MSDGCVAALQAMLFGAGGGVATFYTSSLSASSGAVGTGVTLTLSPGDGKSWTGVISIGFTPATPAATISNVVGGSISGINLTPDAGSQNITMTLTWAQSGAKTVTTTNNGGMTDPADLTYTVTSSFAIPSATTLFRMNAASPSTITTQSGQGAFGAVVTGWSDDNGGAATFSSATPGFVYTQNALGSHPGLEGTVTTYGYNSTDASLAAASTAGCFGLVYRDVGGGSGRNQVYLTPSSSGPWEFRLYSNSVGAWQWIKDNAGGASSNLAGTLTIGSLAVLLLRWDAAGYSVFSNTGSALHDTTDSGSPVIDLVSIQSFAGAPFDLFEYSLFSGTPSDADCQAWVSGRVTAWS